MRFLNLEIAHVLRTDIFLNAPDHALAAWLKAILFSAEQENGGRIAGAAAWNNAKCLRALGMTRRQLHNAAPLLTFEDDDLIVWAYPSDQEVEMRRRREIARRNGASSGGRPLGFATTSKPTSEPTSVLTLAATSTGKQEKGTGSGMLATLASAADASARRRETERSLPASLDTPEFREAWGRWCEHWSESFANGRAMPNGTADAQLRALAELGSARAIAAIEHTIKRGGLREPVEPQPQRVRGLTSTGSAAAIGEGESVWSLQQREKAIRDRMRDLDDGKEGKRYVGNGPGRTTPYDWTDEGRAEYERLEQNLKAVRMQLARAPKETAA